MSGSRHTIGLRGVLILLAVAGGLVAMARGGPPSRLSAGVPAGQPGATPGLEPPKERASCRIGATPLTVDGPIVTTHLSNAGAAPMALKALEIGWGGDAVLSTVVAERADGTETTLFADSATSPAYVLLAVEVSLAAGEGLDLRLGFDGGAVSTAELGPLLGFFDGGCTVAVSVGEASACSVAVSPIRFPQTAPFTAEFQITNEAIEPMVLLGFQMSWPQRQNGSLVSLRLEGQEIGTFAPGQVNSPARIDLTRLIPAEMTLAPGAGVTLRAQFELPVANDLALYSIAVDDATGCQAAPSPRGAADGCGVESINLVPGLGQARLDLVNLEPVTRTLVALDLYWPAGTVGPLREIRGAGGKTIWTGDATRSPAHIAFEAHQTIRPSGRATLHFIFGAAGAQEGARGLSTGEFAVVTHFTGGCRGVISTRAGKPTECSIATGEIRVASTRMSVPVSSTGADARLQRLGLTWPASNGALTEITFGGNSIWAGPPAARSITLTLPVDAQAILRRNEAVELSFGFEGQAASGPYAATLGFSDLEGTPCPELLVTNRARPAECQMELGALTGGTDGAASLAIAVAAAGPNSLQFIRVEWPGGLPSLTGAVLRGQGGRATAIWGPDRPARSPAMLVPEMPTVIEAGDSVLELQFAQPVDAVAAGVAIDIVTDGCQASYQPSARTALPEVVHMNGWLKEFPEEKLFGWWEVVVLQTGDSVVRRVWVDEVTQFEPANINPATGDMVSVTGVGDPDGRLRALKIRFQRPAFVELRGVVEGIDGTDGHWMDVNGQRIHIRDAVIEGRLLVGAVVMVQGTANADGSITAMRVSVIDSGRGEYVELRGVIQNARTDPGQDGIQLWNVDGHRVRVDASVAGLPDPGVLPRSGTQVFVRGRFLDGTIRVVTVEDTARILASGATLTFGGTLVDVPPLGVGQWVVRDDAGATHRVEVRSAAVIDAREAPAEVGVRVRVVAAQSPSGLMAVRVRTTWGTR